MTFNFENLNMIQLLNELESVFDSRPLNLDHHDHLTKKVSALQAQIKRLKEQNDSIAKS